MTLTINKGQVLQYSVSRMIMVSWSTSENCMATTTQFSEYFKGSVILSVNYGLDISHSFFCPRYRGKVHLYFWPFLRSYVSSSFACNSETKADIPMKISVVLQDTMTNLRSKTNHLSHLIPRASALGQIKWSNGWRSYSSLEEFLASILQPKLLLWDSYEIPRIAQGVQ